MESGIGSAVTERDSSLREIVGRHFQSDFIAGQNANAIPAQPPGQVGQHYPFMLQLNAEQAAGKLL